MSAALDVDPLLVDPLLVDPLLVDPLLVAALLHLDLAAPADVVDWATALLATADDERLVELACLQGPSRAEVQDRLDALLSSRGLGRLDDVRAAGLVTRAVARDIVEGKVAPYEGSSLLWWRVARRVPEVEPRLRYFIGLASEWQDDPDAREDCERGMVAEAQALLDDGELRRNCSG